MSSNLKKKTSGFFVTAFIGLIILSFMFTGYESMRGTPDAVATVGGKTINFRDYQNEYNRQLEFYQRFMGGNSLTSQQIEQFGLKDNAISSLVTGKLMIILSEKLGIVPSSYEIKEEIKNLPYFQSNNRFDIERYKLLLSSNGLTPNDFEKSVKEQIKAQNGEAFFRQFPISNKYLEDVQQYKAQRMKGHLVNINREGMRRHLTVSKQEIEEFLSVEANARRVEVMFESQKNTLDQAQEVKARHILITTQDKEQEAAFAKIQELKKQATARNFIRLANENTEDPSGKENGGDLGWFGANGMMVPEFEQAAFALKKGQISDIVKTDFGYHLIYVEDRKEAKEARFEEHRDRLVTELIQRNKVDELDTLVAEIRQQAQDALTKNDFNTLNRLKERYGLSFERDAIINRFDGAGDSQIHLSPESVQALFAKGNSDQIQVFDDVNSITMAKFTQMPPAPAEELQAALEQDRVNLQMTLARQMQQDVLQHLRESVNVKVNRNLIR